jgi:hypothetical protein
MTANIYQEDERAEKFILNVCKQTMAIIGQYLLRQTAPVVNSPNNEGKFDMIYDSCFYCGDKQHALYWLVQGGYTSVLAT